MAEQIALTVEQAAERASLGRTFLYQQIRAGKLRARKAGRRTIVTMADLESYLASLPPRADEPETQGAA